MYLLITVNVMEDVKIHYNFTNTTVVVSWKVILGKNVVD